MQLFHFPLAERICGKEGGEYIKQLWELAGRLEEISRVHGLEERDILSDLLYLIVAKDIARLLEKDAGG